MNANELVSAWGAKKYGKPGAYTIEVEADHGGCPTCGYGEFSGVRIYCDGKQVDELESVDFHDLLNSLLAAAPTAHRLLPGEEGA